MLSRVANRIFWLSRYMERAENTARLIKTYSGLMLDLPHNENVSWYRLVDILGAEEQFRKVYSKKTEHNIMKFLLTERDYGGSLLMVLKYARENARTTRDVFPIEIWDLINDLYMAMKEFEEHESSRSSRFKMLNAIVQGGQRFEGIISEGLSRNDSYKFFILGRMIERADMTTRVLDVGSLMMSGDMEAITAYKGIIWTNILKSINSYQMYRRHVKRRIDGPEVVRFLLNDRLLPRSVKYNVTTMAVFAKQLPCSDNVLRAVMELDGYIMNLENSEISIAQVHKVMDDIQKFLINVGMAINEAWFNY